MRKQKKARTDSTWNGLKADQREKLDDWLFTERLSYADVLDRIAKEFGMTASRSSLARYYHTRREERTMEDLTGAERTSKVVNGMKVNLASLRESSLKLLAHRLQTGAMEGAEIADLTAMAKVLLEAEWRTIQKDRLELAREKFQFDAAEAALAEIPYVGEMTAEELQQEKKRVDGIISRLFGKVPPGESQVPPQGDHVQSSKVLPHGHQVQSREEGEDVKTGKRENGKS
jgi:hypothetical protein